jgi:hypothetical protein
MDTRIVKKNSKLFENYTHVDVMAAAIQVFNTQGFIRSGTGYSVRDPESGNYTDVKDNKSAVMELLMAGYSPSENDISAAQEVINNLNGKLMLKKMTNTLNTFEQGLVKAISEPLTNFHLSIIASIPNSVVIDKKREKFNDRIALLKNHSQHYGVKQRRYDLILEILDVKYIQSTSVYIITGLTDDRDIIKFWWRDQPDISDIIDGCVVNVRGTVINHELNKFNGAKETMLNRVSIKKI